MKYNDPDLWIDAGIEYIWNYGNFMLGVMIAQSQLLMPSKVAWTVGAITGLVGAANHVRALRKAVTP